jgi:undecaprenyl-diphosphatase
MANPRTLSRPGTPHTRNAHAPTPGRHRILPIVGVGAAATVFAVLLILVRWQWPPLESIDRGAAAHLNNAVAAHRTVVTMVKAVTWLGSDGVLWTVILASTLLLAIRRRWRLAGFLLVTGAGAITLDPILKSLVGRLRPVVAHPIAHGGGNSFPSGHSLGSIVCYGAVLLVFLPGVRLRWRTTVTGLLVALVAAIGISRLLLGVHYISDVLGGWALGVTWLGLTTAAFELSRRATGQPVTQPITEGLEPEARTDVEPSDSSATEPSDAAGRHPVGIAAAVAVAWVLIVGAVVGVGELIVRGGPHRNLVGDETIPHWFAARRTPAWTAWSQVFSVLGATQAILIVAIATCVIALAVTRRWRPVVYVATVMVGELAAFLVTAAIIMRPRPDVQQLDSHLPTSAYPSGHEAATCCLYGAIAVLVLGTARGWWRWLSVVPAVAMPVLVAVSRMYRGEHHPTDILGSLIFAALWITAACLLIKPNSHAHTRDHTAVTEETA